MTHKIKIEHRTVEGLLSSLVGGAAVGAFMSRSWVLAATAFLLVVVLLITERRDLKDEDEPVSQSEPVREMEKGLVLGGATVAALHRMSRKKPSVSEPPSYEDGLIDGTAITAQFVLGTMEDEDAEV